MTLYIDGWLTNRDIEEILYQFYDDEGYIPTLDEIEFDTSDFSDRIHTTTYQILGEMTIREEFGEKVKPSYLQAKILNSNRRNYTYVTTHNPQ